MTTKDSICVMCEHLSAETSDRVITDSGIHLISFCGLCEGKNAGNRKTCRKFQIANTIKIIGRLEALEERGKEV